MPADYLSWLPLANMRVLADITECFDPFQAYLINLQRADKNHQHINHFWVQGQWLTS